MAVILAVETATRNCSVVVGVDGHVVASRSENSERLSHAEKINVFAAEVLAEAGVPFSRIDAFAVGIGPGSYTGLRIGSSAVKGWCFALDRPVIGITTLRGLVQAALRQGVGTGMEIWPMIDARRMEVFTQPFDHTGKIIGGITPLILDSSWVDQADRKRVVLGDGADKAVELWQNTERIIHLPNVPATAGDLLASAEERYALKEFDDLAYLVPEYGKEANLTPPKKK